MPRHIHPNLACVARHLSAGKTVLTWPPAVTCRARWSAAAAVDVGAGAAGGTLGPEADSSSEQRHDCRLGAVPPCLLARLSLGRPDTNVPMLQ